MRAAIYGINGYSADWQPRYHQAGVRSPCRLASVRLQRHSVDAAGDIGAQVKPSRHTTQSVQERGLPTDLPNNAGLPTWPKVARLPSVASVRHD